MRPVIIDADKERYAYLFDIMNHNRVFAIDKEELRRFKTVYGEFQHCLEKLNETETVRVVRLEEIRDNVFKITANKKVPYPIKKLYFTANRN
jgi:hypothetical protein